MIVAEIEFDESTIDDFWRVYNCTNNGVVLAKLYIRRDYSPLNDNFELEENNDK